GLEHEMAPRVGFEPDLAAKARLGLLRLRCRHLRDGPRETLGTERGSDVIEEIEEREAAKRHSSPQKRLVERMSCAWTQETYTPLSSRRPRGIQPRKVRKSPENS